MDELSSWLKEPLDSRQLLALLHLSRTGSFTEAARCGVRGRTRVHHGADPSLGAARQSAARGDPAAKLQFLYHRSSQTGALADHYFRRERIVLNTVIELGSMEAIKELLKLGLGVGILAPWIAREELQNQALVALPLGRRKLDRRWAVLQLKGRRPSLAEETFIGESPAVLRLLRIMNTGTSE